MISTPASTAVATGEFQDVLHYYPLDDMAGQRAVLPGRDCLPAEALRRRGELHTTRCWKGSAAIAKAPAAQLHKGLALLAVNKRDAGVHELRLLIQRHPRTPEAASARSKLNGMGVRTVRCALSQLGTLWKEKPR